MARIAGVDLPAKKRAEIGLTYIYGIGRSRSLSLLNRAGVDPEKKVSDLTEEEVNRVRTLIENEGAVEGDLRKELSMNVKRLIEMGSYRGLRHRRGLPTRGQRTHTNARTRKGPRRGTVANKKKASAKT
ncbi:MAG: 30S ribosomal protein S13 [Acidobacteriota bacterium]|jgi:small subunit ribosomal protein S13|nr:30S ribosomal protein S13 [Acidobacteriota bacterium]